MDERFLLITADVINKLAISEILDLNATTSPYGLSLTAAEAQELVATRKAALSGNGRIEFAGGIINKIILAFCDSPYINQFEYAAIINELIETFYYFKNETMDEISDDDLIAVMKQYFDNNCQGSIELLQSRDLESLARRIRFGIKDYADRRKEARRLSAARDKEDLAELTDPEDPEDQEDKSENDK